MVNTKEYNMTVFLKTNLSYKTWSQENHYLGLTKLQISFKIMSSHVTLTLVTMEPMVGSTQ